MRRLTHHASRITYHASLLAASSLLLLPGCAPSPGPAQLHGQLFSRVEIIGSRGTGVGQLNKPRSVAVDAQDNLYVVDMTGRVQKFSPQGVFLLSWQMPQTDLGKPKGMCRDRAGHIVVLEPHYSRVNLFSTAGELVGQWGAHGTNAGQLSLPRAVAVDSHNEIFVSEYQEAERVQKFALDGVTTIPPHANPTGQSPSSGNEALINTPLQRGGTADVGNSNRFSGFAYPRWLASFGQSGTHPGQFNRPEGLCVDSHDQLCVADSCNHRIQVFSSDGKFLRTYGKPGKGLGELSYPYDICVDSAGRQYVCEFGNSRIQIFDSHDQPLEIIGGPGSDPGQFSNPWGVALDSLGNLYVADSQNHRVQKLVRSAPSTVSSPQSLATKAVAVNLAHSPMPLQRGAWSVERGASSMDLAGDLWPVDSGLQAPDFGLWTLDFGLGTP
jgi:DNA-binding beta-propeller fold protein YncE